MADRGRKYTEAQAANTLVDNPLTQEQITALDTSSQIPSELVMMATKCDFVMIGMEWREVKTLFAGVELDFEDLMVEFTKACPDFAEDLTWSSKAQCLKFCSHILFHAAPDGRRIPKSKVDKLYRYNFVTRNSDNSKVIDRKFVLVLPHKISNAPTMQPKFNHHIVLNIQQASLLATHTFMKVIESAYENQFIILTPLARAIFSTEDIVDLCKELKASSGDGGVADNKYIANTLCAIVASCQSGGYYLTQSEAHIAACAAISATKNIKDRKLAEQIVGKIISQYALKGKIFDHNKFKIYAKYATGGVPSELPPNILMDPVPSIQRLKIIQMRDIYNTARVMHLGDIENAGAGINPNLTVANTLNNNARADDDISNNDDKKQACSDNLKSLN